MKASETNFQPVIEGTKQYVVPLFQRPYSWDKNQWEVLWDDVTDLYNDESLKSHFIGSIVTMPDVSVPEGITKYLLIDGQQRLTTIFIILILLRDKANEQGNNELANEIQATMLVNPYKKENDYFKLLPTQSDRLSFQSLFKQKPVNEENQVFKCYKFFERKVNQLDIRSLNKVLTGRFSIVSIVLDHDDNPHLVFESLNAKGRLLTQADLIRNYFFMRIHTDEQEEIYAKFWNPMQISLGDNLTECIRHYMMRNGSLVKQGDIYYTLKDKVKTKNVLVALEEISIFAEYYKKIIFPTNESNSEIRNMLIRLNRLEVTTTYPFLLNCYHDYTQKHLSISDFIAVLKILENYILRRFVCNMSTSQYNKLFPYLYDWSKANNPANFVDGLRKMLQVRDYPKDNFFRSRLIEAKLYGPGERANKTKLILETIEGQFQHKEKVTFDNLTIEHVLPQTPTDWWKQNLGENWLENVEFYLHTLGNLTLTAYNSELSNDSFPSKQKQFLLSHLEINRYFSAMKKWDQEEIEKRSNVLADLALQYWSYFGDDKPTNTVTAEDVTGRTPQTLIILGQRMTVESWRDVLRKTLNTIADLEPEKFEILASNYPRSISKDIDRFKRKTLLDNGYYVDINLKAKSTYRFCEQAIETIGLSRMDWVIETD